MKGFTLIELLIVVALFAVMMVVVVSFFLSSVVQQEKVSSMMVVKQTGNQVLMSMANLIRGSKSVTSPCTSTPTNSLTVLTRDNASTTFALSGGTIASSSGTTTLSLTPVSLSVPSGPTFTCIADGDGNVRSVTIAFTLQKGVTGVDSARDITTQTFATTVGLRTK